MVALKNEYWDIWYIAWWNCSWDAYNNLNWASEMSYLDKWIYLNWHWSNDMDVKLQIITHPRLNSTVTQVNYTWLSPIQHFIGVSGPTQYSKAVTNHFRYLIYMIASEHACTQTHIHTHTYTHVYIAPAMTVAAINVAQFSWYNIGHYVSILYHMIHFSGYFLALLTAIK